MFYSFCLLLYSAQVTCLGGTTFSVRNLDLAVPLDVRGLFLSYDDKGGISYSKLDKRKMFSKFSYVAVFFSGLSYWCCYSNSIYKKNILSLETNAINNRKEYGDRTVVASLRLSYIEIISKGVMITTTEVFGFAPCINDN